MTNIREHDNQFKQVFEALDGKANQEIEFLNKAFGFLQRQTAFFSSESAAQQTFQLAKRIHFKSQDPSIQTSDEASVQSSNTEAKSTDELQNPLHQTKPSYNADPPEAKGLPGNGGKTDLYEWTQTLSELSIHFSLPLSAKSRDIKVRMTPTSLFVQTPHLSREIKGNFPSAIIPDDSTWILGKWLIIFLLEEREPKLCICLLTIQIKKLNKMNWWSSIIVGEPEIDTKQIAPQNSRLDDLDAETRQTVEKMMFDQRQKQLGKPTSEEEKKSKLLESFMKQHPEMDFSQAKVL